MKASTAFAAAGIYAVALQGVAATWRGVPGFQIPINFKNECDNTQSKGWDWSDLVEGAIKEFGNFKFSGWECRTRPSKRTVPDLFGSRNSKCISTVAKKGSFTNEIRHKDRGFSIDYVDVRADEDDTEFDFHFEMPDGKTCKQTARCGKQTKQIKNTQCGGAKAVKVQLPKKSIKEKCGINFDFIKFECNDKVTPPPEPSSPCECKKGEKDCKLPSYCKPSCDECAKNKKKPGCEDRPECTPKPPSCEECKKDSKKSGCDKVLKDEKCNPKPKPSTSDKQTMTIEPPTTSSVKPPASSNISPGVPSSSISSVNPPASSSNSPVGSSSKISPPSSNISSTSIAPSGTISTSSPPPNTTAPPPPPPSASSSASPPSSSTIITVTPPDCPDTLPKCIKTWLFKTNCSDNADSSCFCPNAEFVERVYECLSSYADSDTNLSKATEYFLSMCKPHIPENPKIVDCIPDNIVVPPLPPNVPAQTITRIQTSVVTETVSGTAVTNVVSTLVQTIQLPQVTFTVSSGEVRLVYPPVTVSAGQSVPPVQTSPGVPTTLASSVKSVVTAVPLPSNVFTGAGTVMKPAAGIVALVAAAVVLHL